MQPTFFKHARNMSLMSNFHKCHMGCVVVYKNKVIGTGFNSSKTHPVQKEYNKLRFNCEQSPHTLHSEIHALYPLMNDKSIEWKKVHVYVYREHKDGVRAMARPCKSCMQLIKDLGIRYVHYTTEDGFATEEIVYQ